VRQERIRGMDGVGVPCEQDVGDMAVGEQDMADVAVGEQAVDVHG